MRGRLCALIISALCLTSPAFAARFFFAAKNPIDGRVQPAGARVLVLSGEIVPGDYDRLLERIALAQPAYLARNELILASDGGDVAEALKIARLVKSMFTTAVVGPVYGRCVSACFLIYSSANVRMGVGDVLGIHRPYLPEKHFAAMSPGDAEKAQSSILASARKYLQENDVPTYLVEEMFRRASNDVYWLSAYDIIQLGEKSHWFDQYLVAKCGWDDRVEWGALQEDARYAKFFAEMHECFDRVTRPAAEDALSTALHQEAAKKGSSQELESIRGAVIVDDLIKHAPRCHDKSTVDPTTDECPDFK